MLATAAATANASTGTSLAASKYKRLKDGIPYEHCFVVERGRPFLRVETVSGTADLEIHIS